MKIVTKQTIVLKSGKCINDYKMEQPIAINDRSVKVKLCNKN